MNRLARPTPIVIAAFLGALALAPARGQDAKNQEARRVFDPVLTTPETLAPYLDHLDPGRDGFADEQVAQALEARLNELGAWLQTRPSQAGDLRGFFAPTFRGSQL